MVHSPLVVDDQCGRIYRFAARTRDVVVSLAALVICAPLIFVLAVVVRRSTGAGAMFRQLRLGKDGQPLVLVKLRTLRPEAPTGVHRNRSEHLATPSGRFLRKYKLDELPQFWNVLRGDMALVGPRPIIPEEYTSDQQRVRLAVRPGLTGLWQLSRVRERPFFESPEYDLFYLANRSFTFDLWLMWRTVLLLTVRKQTRIRMAARLWEHNRDWRRLVPERSKAIPEPLDGPRARFSYALGMAALLALLAPGVGVALSARSDLLAAQNAMVESRRAATGLDAQKTEALLEEASGRFQAAESKLSGWLTLPLRVIPGFNNNIEVPEALAVAGHDLVDAGHAGLEVLNDLPVDGSSDQPLMTDDTLNLEPFFAVSSPADRLRSNLASAQQTISGTATGFLFPQVADARLRALEIVAAGAKEAQTAAVAAQLLPQLFGATEPRTWLLGAENNAELRGRGGYMGSFGLLTADKGRLELGNFQHTSGLPRLPDDPSGMEAPAEYAGQYLTLGGLSAWQNLLMSPDFPTGAQLMLSNLERHAGIAADGLISLDPMALSYLLEVTGPVEVPEIPEAITADNVVDWTLNRLYLLYGEDNPERKEQLSTIADAVWSRLLSDGHVDMEKVARALGRAASERHLVVYSSHPEEQQLLEQVGIAGSVEDSAGDYLMLVGQNFGQNKMDYYISRNIVYTGVLTTDGDLDGEVEVTVTNHAPPGVEISPHVGGEPAKTGRASGVAHTFFSLFVPERVQLRTVLRDGVETSGFQNSTELGKRRLSTLVTVAPGEAQKLSFKYHLPEAVVDGLYELNVQKQSTVRPDELTMQLQLPSEQEVTAFDGFTGRNPLAWEGELISDLELSAQVQKTWTGRLVAQLNSFLREPLGSSSNG